MKYGPDSNVPPRVRWGALIERWIAGGGAGVSIEASVGNEARKLEKSYTCLDITQATQHCALERIKELYSLCLDKANLDFHQSKKNKRNQR